MMYIETPLQSVSGLWGRFFICVDCFCVWVYYVFALSVERTHEPCVPTIT